MFGLFKSKTKILKHKHLINLIALAKSDGNVDDKEVELLKKIAYQNGISDRSFLAIFNTSETIDIDLSLSKEERLTQLYDFIQMMLIDGEVTKNEIDFCYNVAKNMEYNIDIIPDLVNTIMSRIKNGESKEVVCNALSEAV